MTVDTVITEPARPVPYITITIRDDDGRELARAKVERGREVIQWEFCSPVLPIDGVERLVQEAQGFLDEEEN